MQPKWQEQEVYMRKLIFLSGIAALFFTAQLQAQLISIKTVPVASGSQFEIFPSQTLGMGSVSIAIDDPWLDIFVNPAKGDSIMGLNLFLAPTFSSLIKFDGSIQSLPGAVTYGNEKWFAAFSAVSQTVKTAGQDQVFWADQELLSDNNNRNSFYYASLGKHVPDKDLSIGISAFYAKINALQGVSLLYNRQNPKQNGYLYDIRLGLVKNLSKMERISALLLYNYFDMTHTYQTWINTWDDVQGFWISGPQEIKNLDQSKTYGFQLEYVKPLTESGWNFGSQFTFNKKSHPKIPNYEIMNIPRDPGDSYAYNFGVGLSRTKKTVSVAFDFIYEPIFTHTWADAANDIEIDEQRTIRKGQMTVENNFVFSNWRAGIGFKENKEPFGIQLGLQVHNINYSLDQKNYIEQNKRKQNENWMEWTFSWGFHYAFSLFKFQYTGFVISGTGRPGTAPQWAVRGMQEDMMFGDYIPAPEGALTLDESAILVHRFTIAIPID